MSWYRRSRRNRYDSYYPPYVSVAEKKRLAEETVAKLKKKNPNMSPVVVEGRTLATTWWGKSWNENLTKYADYSNRVGRGRSYVSNGAVLDLQIKEGEVHSLVQGSVSTPYKIVVKIGELNKSIWESIKKSCSNKLSSLSELLAGKLPKDVGEIFTAIGSGLFPEPKAMKFSCSCPDGAHMCKHVAATLYGVGSRLDQNPSLLFTLRKVNMKELVKETLSGVKDELTKKATSKSIKKSRVISDTNVEQLFGIEMAANNVADNVEDKPKRKTKTKDKINIKVKSTVKNKIKSKKKVTKAKVNKKKTTTIAKSKKKVAVAKPKTKSKTTSTKRKTKASSKKVTASNKLSK